MKLLKLIWSDLERYFETVALHTEKTPNKLKIILESVLFKAGFHTVLLYRLAHAAYRCGFTYIPWALSRFNQFATAAEIEYNAEIGPGLFIAHPAGIVIGRGSKLGKNVNVYQRVTLGTHNMVSIKFPVLEDYVTVFAGATILGDVSIGTGAVIGANSVVTKNIPSGALVIDKKVILKRGSKVTKFKRN